MPYCPRCGDEFQNWVHVCPVCGVDLVDRLPKSLTSKPKQQAKARQDPLVHMATAPNEPLARMWADILENEGIRCLIRSRDLSPAMYVPSLLSPREIHVLASQAEKARQVLTPFLEIE